jgi:hypothetical protein
MFFIYLEKLKTLNNMKKILLIAAVASLGAASCQKDRTCTCTTGGQSQDIIFKNATKSQAKAGCVSTSETNNGVTVTTDCKLK